MRFFRNGDKHHHPVTVAINEQELKSWEAFLNYLNRQPKLLLSSGGIRHIYTLNGREIRAITKFQSRHSYVVASSVFLRTNYRHVNDEFSDDLDTTVDSAASVNSRWRSPPTHSEQIFLLPYSRLNVYESLILNRNSTATFDRWLQDQVTDLLSRYINHNSITHLYAVTKLAFTEVERTDHVDFILRWPCSRSRASRSCSIRSRRPIRSSAVRTMNSSTRNITSAP